MMHLSEDMLGISLAYPNLIAALRQGFPQKIMTPDRPHFPLTAERDGASENVLLVMPAWSEDYLGVKLVTVFPDNRRFGLPSLTSSYSLFSGSTGRQLATLDGNELTKRRTVATSALAASYLARPDSQKLLIIGSGHIASGLYDAYAAMLPLSVVRIWNVNRDSAVGLAAGLRERGVDAEYVADLAEAVAAADIVSCATLATEIVLKGEWLTPGTHVDLIGSFSAKMREADSGVFARAEIYVDTKRALQESGDFIHSIKEGVFSPGRLRGTLPELCGGIVPGRQNAEQITLFKSVGSGQADLIAAQTAYEHLNSGD